MNRHRGENYLRDWEIALVKAMLKEARPVIQNIQSYFSRPGRSINQARIHEIKEGAFPEIKLASANEVECFRKKWRLVKLPEPDNYQEIIADDDISGHWRKLIRAFRLKLFARRGQRTKKPTAAKRPNRPIRIKYTEGGVTKIIGPDSKVEKEHKEEDSGGT